MCNNMDRSNNSVKFHAYANNGIITSAARDNDNFVL